MKNSMRFVTLFLVFLISLALTACGTVVSPPAAQKPAAEVTGKNAAEKVLSIANIVSQQNKGLLVVSDARIVAGGANVLLIDGKTHEVQGVIPLWQLIGDKGDSVVHGLLYSVAVIKSSALLSEQDANDTQSALTDILSLSAKTFLQGNAQEFSFIEIALISPPFTISLYHISSKDIVTERARGADADWATLVLNHEAFVDQAFVFVIPPPQDGSPQPTPGQ